MFPVFFNVRAKRAVTTVKRCLTSVLEHPKIAAPSIREQSRRSRIMLKALAVGILLGVILVFAGVWFYFMGGHAPVAVADPALPFERKIAHGSLHAFMDKQKPVEAPIHADA